MLTQNLKIEQQDTVVIATVTTSQLTLIESQEMIDELGQRLRNDNAQQFLLDLADVEFMSSACLGSLLQFLQELEHIRGRLVLANCQPNVALLFSVMRLDKIFALYDSVDEALLALKHE